MEVAAHHIPDKNNQVLVVRTYSIVNDIEDKEKYYWVEYIFYNLTFHNYLKNNFPFSKNKLR